MATFDEYFGPTRMMCRVVGIWPLEMEAPLAKRILHWTANILMMLGLLNFILPQALLIVDSMGNFSTIMPVCAIMAVTMLLGWKQLYFTLYHAKLGHIFSELKDIWYEVDAVPEQRKIYNGYARNCRLLTIGLLMSTIINNTLSTATAIVDWWKFNRGTREPGLVRHLPYELRYPFDTDATPRFEIAFAIQEFFGVTAAICYAGLDSLILSLVFHACAHFAALRMFFKETANRENHAGGRVVLREDVTLLRQGMGRCVERHNRIIRLAEEIEHLFGPVVLGQYVFSAVNLCLCGYSVTAGIENKIDLLRFVGFLVSCMSQISAFCFASEMLIRESTGVGETVFHDVPWYNFPIALQRDLQLTIIRAQKCCCLTAAGFAVLNMVLLPNILSAAFSYFTLLRQVKVSQNE